MKTVNHSLIQVCGMYAAYISAPLPGCDILAEGDLCRLHLTPPAPNTKYSGGQDCPDTTPGFIILYGWR